MLTVSGSWISVNVAVTGIGTVDVIGPWMMQLFPEMLEQPVQATVEPVDAASRVTLAAPYATLSVADTEVEKPVAESVTVPEPVPLMLTLTGTGVWSNTMVNEMS